MSVEKKNINEATAQEIADRVSMIGKEKAQAIVDYREGKGNFTTLAEVANVPGFSKKLVDSLGLYYTCGEEDASDDSKTKAHTTGTKKK